MYSTFLQRSKKLSTAGRPSSSVNTKQKTYWDDCLPVSNTLKEHDYVWVQADPNAQTIAEDNPELIEILTEL